MRPQKIVLAEDTELTKALALYEDRCRTDPVLEVGDWRLVGTHIIPTAKPLSGFIATGNQSMQLVVTVIGIFEQQKDTGQMMKEGFQAMLGEGSAEYFQRQIKESNCEHEWGDDLRCIHCGAPM